MEKCILTKIIEDFNSNEEEKKKNSETKLLELCKKWISDCKKTSKKFNYVDWTYKTFTQNNGKVEKVLTADQNRIVFYGTYKGIDYDTGYSTVRCAQYIYMGVEDLYDDAIEKFKESCRLSAIIQLENSIEDYKRKIEESEKEIAKIRKIR